MYTISEGWNDNHFAQLESHDCCLATKGCEIVFVASANSLDEAMDAKPFEQTSHLTTVFAVEILAQRLVGEPLDDEFAAEQGA